MAESLENLEKKISSLKSTITKQHSNQSEIGNSRSNGSNVLIELIVSLGIATFIGYHLDTFFKTKVLFLFIFIILGLVSSIYSINKKLK